MGTHINNTSALSASDVGTLISSQSKDKKNPSFQIQRKNENYIVITISCNLTPQTVILFVPKSPPACYAAELGVSCTIASEILMKPIQSGELKNNIGRAYVQYLDTGEIEHLSIKSGSRCHFFDPIILGDDKIILRLDWGDIDTNGNPTLDADFYNTQTGKKRSLSGVRRNSHHTNSTTNENRSYEWVFGEYSRPFKVVICLSVSVVEKVTVSDSVTFEVFRNGVKEEK